jgi:putative FmdB family regulatory protein
MPTYDYKCTKCGHVFEVFHKMTDKALDKCPKCKGKVKKLISSGTGLIFKGSGFYATDYKKKPPISCPKAKDGGCSGCH